MTFQTQASKFMQTIATRQQDPVRANTLSTYKSLLNARILPVLGGLDLSEVKNGVVKRFFEGLRGKLSPSTQRTVFNIIKQVVESAVNEEGDQLYPLKWNHAFIDVPTVKTAEQDAPIVSPKAIQNAIRTARNEDKALYALLAGSGLRVGEALALCIGPDDDRNSFWQPETKTLTIRTTVVKGKIQTGTKTQAGIRAVDLSEELNVFLTKSLSHCETGLLFKSEKGGIVRTNTAYEHLEEAGIQEGFHAFRRFRLTHLDAVGVPQGLQRYWGGHSAGDVHESYVKMGEKILERKDWAQKAGLGFQLEAV